MTSVLINIVSAKLVGAYKIRLCFDDNTEQKVDFKDFLARSVHPAIRAALAPRRFAAFEIEYGELV